MYTHLYRSVGWLFALLGLTLFLTIVLETICGFPVVAAGPFFASYGLAFGGCAFFGLGIMMVNGATDSDFRFNAGKPLSFALAGAVIMRLLALGNEGKMLADTGWTLLSPELVSLMWYGEISLFAILAVLFSRAK